MKASNGRYILLEDPELGVLIKDGNVVNEDAYKIWAERQKQSKYVPTQQDRNRAKEAKKAEAELLAEENAELKSKVDHMESMLETIMKKIDEKD